jgi:hypothetical protein
MIAHRREMMMNRRKNDGGWFLLGLIAGPFGVFCVALGILFIVLAVMI